ncbi:hypothetical protein EDM59_05330 [Brevibacillus nitrificans]|nr:hypothetical protein EDM59_05330 [Brevibacillus nitrificans]
MRFHHVTAKLSLNHKKTFLNNFKITIYIICKFTYIIIMITITKNDRRPTMTKVKAKPNTTTTTQKKRSYEDTLNNLAHYLERNKKK